MNERKLMLRKAVLSAVALILLSTPQVSLAEKPRIGSSKLTVVAFGDSTTAPRGPLIVYADILRKELASVGLKSTRVINAGIGGNTTAMAMKRFRNDVLRHGPSLVIIQFGINDSAFDVWKNPPATESRVSKETYRKNLLSMLKTLKARGTSVILMTPNTLTWQNEKVRKLYGKSPYYIEDEDGFNVLLKGYVETMKQVGKDENVPVLDVFTAFRTQKDAKPSDLLLDGLHPNARGQRIVANLLLKQIASMKDQIKPSVYGERIHTKAKELPHKLLGPFVRLADGTIMAADAKCIQVSDDEGATWKRSDAIDIGEPGGYGDHGGTMEGTIVELKDGRIYQLLRTTTGRFWETNSSDGGLTWEKPQPSKIVSSSSPGMLQRLKSGRIALAWNQNCNTRAWKNFGRRARLFMALSDDECKSWSEPVQVATNLVPPGDAAWPYRHAYPSIFECTPGETWLTTMQGMVRMSFSERDLLEGVSKPQ